MRVGGVDFSPEVIVWKNRRDVRNSIFRWHKGAWLNRAIIKRSSKVFGIQRLLSTTLTEDERLYKICIDKFKRLNLDVYIYRSRFLVRRLKEDFARYNIKRSK